ncbi:MAG: HAMP domain-containing histidine kinase [Solirubrobacterales bacterium]|nr:HAMP domain-containing histidine kinase [Solirubrobacterales bacterium]
MTRQLVLLGGWAAAAVAGALALFAWRALSSLTETVARACHELRGPIAAARLGLHLGARTGELSPPTLRALDLELGRASLALEDLTDTRRAGLAPRTAEQVDVAALLADSAAAWRPSAAQRGVDLTARWASGPAYVFGDRLRLAQATGNLIANAIEHGEGPVEAQGRVDGLLVRIEIRDHGPGLPASVAELTRRSRRSPGQRGRGLTIAAGIAASHGGRLAAAPSERGARLVLELPLSDSAPAARALLGSNR